VNGDATVKRFFRERTARFVFSPRTSEMAPIVVKGEFSSRGRVVAVLRRYR
jgi:SOS-response transcriptional repressor LexA